MANKISMLAFDLDDTALDGEGKLSDATREAFIAAAEAGIEPVIASGRSFYSLPDYLLEVPGIRYAICSNGANLFDVKNKRGTRQAASLPWVSVLKNILRQRTIKMNPMFRYTPSSLTVTA